MSSIFDLYEGDCIKIMDELISMNVKVDMVLADIPFGSTRAKWDNIIPFDKMWDRISKLKKNDRTPVLLFGQTPFDKVLGSSNIKELKYEWIWEKGNATGHLNAKKMPMKCHENILVFYKKPPIYNPQKTTGHKRKVSTLESKSKSKDSVLYNKGTYVVGYDSTERYPRDILKFSSDKQKSKLHPTQKPVKLMEYFILTYTNEGDIVLDFTMGVATTGIGCINTGRGFIGIDNCPVIFRKAVKRCSDHREIIT